MRRLDPRVLIGLLIGVEVVVLAVAERRAPARVPREMPATRARHNGVIGGIALLGASLLEAPLVGRVAAEVERRGWGFVPRTRLPRAIRALVAVALLDYGMYAWHAALHRVPWLWRLHVVHHADRDCDISTAVRIHAVEIAVSVGVRALQVVAVGVGPAEFALWQGLFAASVIFHHANVALPEAVERVLGAIVMTPRRHGFHHLARRDAQGANLSAGLIVWDRVHGTLRDGKPEGPIGVPAYARPEDVALGKMLLLPFVSQPDPWRAR